MPRALSCPYVRVIATGNRSGDRYHHAMSEEKSIVLLYYHFTSIEDPKALTEQRYLCQKLALKGRILIATEGINGTLGGSAASARAYQETMSEQFLFKGMEFKISEYATNPFGKLSVKARKNRHALESMDLLIQVREVESTSHQLSGGK